jgi:hypothetical protein
MTKLKDIQDELNLKKAQFAKHIVSDTVTQTTAIAEKTKDANYAGQIAKAAQDLASVDTNIPDIIISGGGTGAPVAEPSVDITHPNLMNRVFYQGAPIQLMFETKNVHKPYSCYVFANTIGIGSKRIDLFVDQNIRFDKHTIPNILVNKVNKELPPGKYDIFVVLYDNNNGQRKQLKDSKGQPVVANTQRIMGIEIRPPVTTGTVSTANPEIHITNKGDFHKVFAGADQVPLIFEVKNIQKYAVSIFLQKDANNAIELETRKYNIPIVSQSLPIRDLVRKKDSSLNLTEYKALVVILRDEHGNPLSGGKLMDSVNISVAPLAVSQRSESSTSSNLRLLRPTTGDSIPNSGPIDLEFETTLPTPFSYVVNIPKAGGLIHEAQSDYKYANTQISPKAIYKEFVKGIRLKKGKFKFELHIYYPANSNTVVATKTIDVNIV